MELTEKMKQNVQANIELMKAYLDGAEIQQYQNCEWVDCPVPSFNFTMSSYRVKPRKPLEVWVIVWKDTTGTFTYKTKEECEKAIALSSTSKPTLFREVME